MLFRPPQVIYFCSRCSEPLWLEEGYFDHPTGLLCLSCGDLTTKRLSRNVSGMIA